MGQSASLENIRQHFIHYGRENLQEKLFVHTDKSFYLAGELIWFKIYDVDGSFHKPLELTKVAYVELLDQAQKPVAQAKISMQEGTGNGSFFLPVSLHSGNFTLRAYTNWMKNFNSSYFFEKRVTVVNTLRSPDPVQQTDSATYRARFFPEGGDLVQGLQNRLALEILDTNGKGVEGCQGALLDQNGDTAVQFKSGRFGLGNFYFRPEANKIYHAVIKIGTDTIIQQELPRILEKGFVMNLVDAGSDSLKLTVETNSTVSDVTLLLLIHTRQVLDLTETLQLNKNKAIFFIDKKKLGEGISQLTIFNSARQPLCERLYFKKPGELHLRLETDQKVYGLRHKVELGIQSENESGSPLASNLSMSVFLLDSLQSPEDVDILSYLWLQSDLKGHIESPAYYFRNSGKEVEETTDNLMMTHGWRRFRWEDVLSNERKIPEFIPEFEGHIVRGRILDNKNSSPADDITAYLSVPGEKSLFCAATSDQNGNLHFDVKDFFGSEEVIVQTNGWKDSSYHVNILSPFSEKNSGIGMPSLRLSKDQEGQLLERSINSQVQNAYLAAQINRFLNPIPDSSLFFGRPDRTYLLDDYVRFSSMEDVFREYVTEVLLKRERGKNHTRVALPGKGFFDEDPLVLVDGVPHFNPDSILALDPLKMRKLDVVKRKYFIGPAIAPGIISFISYKKDLSDIQLEPGALVVEYPGLQLQREFYSPTYNTEARLHDRMPDFRNVLYWSPEIKTGSSGREQASFYTSDQAGRYAVMIQGITPDGKAGSQLIVFDVKN